MSNFFQFHFDLCPLIKHGWAHITSFFYIRYQISMHQICQNLINRHFFISIPKIDKDKSSILWLLFLFKIYASGVPLVDRMVMSLWIFFSLAFKAIHVIFDTKGNIKCHHVNIFVISNSNFVTKSLRCLWSVCVSFYPYTGNSLS